MQQCGNKVLCRRARHRAFLDHDRPELLLDAHANCPRFLIPYSGFFFLNMLTEMRYQIIQTQWRGKQNSPFSPFIVHVCNGKIS
ncbi:hypothetical protein D3C77_515060 [compost metagenome]